MSLANVCLTVEYTVLKQPSNLVNGFGSLGVTVKMCYCRSQGPGFQFPGRGYAQIHHSMFMSLFCLSHREQPKCCWTRSSTLAS